MNKTARQPLTIADSAPEQSVHWFPHPPGRFRNGSFVALQHSGYTAAPKYTSPTGVSTMSLQLVPCGRNVPEDINVIIEIPMNSEPVKYEVDKVSGAIFVDRLLTTPMRYPCNYGYVPHGDPLDALVMMPMQLLPGCVIRCRPIGMLEMEDEAGGDEKLVVVPHDKVSPLYKDVDTVRALPQLIRDQIAHFFEHYKDLEKGKWVKIKGWHGPNDAKRAITKAIETFNKAAPKPSF
jgi:inorganic pyrophosphatase